jgi:hypothetical protein
MRRQIVTGLALLLAAGSLRPIFALPLERDLTGADSCGINRTSQCPGAEQPNASDQASFVRIAGQIQMKPGCNTHFGSERCHETADLIHTRRVVLEGARVVTNNGLPHQYFQPGLEARAGGSLSPRSMQLADADSIWDGGTGGQPGRLYGSDIAAVTESWATLAYRFDPHVGPSGIWLSLRDTLLGPFQEIHRYSSLEAQLLDGDSRDEWILSQMEAVPEPGRLATLIAGLFGIYAVARRRISSI